MKKYIVFSASVLVSIFTIHLTEILGNGLGGHHDSAEASCLSSVGGLGQPIERRTYVLDTNVLRDRPNVLSELGAHHLVLPFAVLQELDRQKKIPGDVGAEVRGIVRRIFTLAKQNPGQIIRLPEGGTLEFRSPSPASFGDNLNVEIADHAIIATVRELATSSRHPILVTGDMIALLTASSLGLQVTSIEDIMTSDSGHEDESLPFPLFATVTEDKLEELGRLNMIPSTEFDRFGIPRDHRFYDNQFVVFRVAGERPAFNFEQSLSTLVWRYKSAGGSDGGAYLLHMHKREISRLPIRPRNLEQLMALDLLLDPKINLVTLAGTAGSGKTLLAITAMMAQSPYIAQRGRYERVILLRPHILVGKEHGHLKGSLKEKLRPLFAPFEDNLPVWVEAHRRQLAQDGTGKFTHSVGEQIEAAEIGTRPRRSRGSSRSGAPKGPSESGLEDEAYEINVKDLAGSRFSPDQMAAKMIFSTYIQPTAIAYARGRTLRDALIIVDEGQNVTREEMQIIASRVGEGSTLVVLGDPDQTDARQLTAHINGLVRLARGFKSFDYAGHVNLPKGERSRLSSDAARVLR